MQASTRVLLAAAVSVAIAITANAQATGSAYRTAAGFKFSPAAVSIKHFVKSNAAVEGLATFWKNGARITGLYEWHGPIQGARGLNWYAGLGAHIDAWNEKYRSSYKAEGHAAAGADGVLGLDYKFNGAPINLSLDWQPSVTFIGGSYSNAGWLGIAFRYAW
jgi:hypothetical protein